MKVNKWMQSAMATKKRKSFYFVLCKSCRKNDEEKKNGYMKQTIQLNKIDAAAPVWKFPIQMFFIYELRFNSTQNFYRWICLYLQVVACVVRYDLSVLTDI